MTKSKVFSHVFDNETLRNINKLRGDGYISNLLGPIGTGKESYVFYSRDFHDKLVAVKMHRHDIDAFKKIPIYIRLRGKKSGGFIKRINDWTRFEYYFLSKAYNLGINVPEPIRCYENIIVMGFIGREGDPAKTAIKNADFDHDKWYKLLVKFIVDMAKNGFVHGDLSPYNILNYNKEPYLIDFSQSLKLSQLTKEFLVRDIENINKWFRSLGYTDIFKTEDIMHMIGLNDENE
ncbi:MAG: RIO1 family regulatory kinase/ATPase [Candidatus Parvarchaeum sp.]